MTVAIPTERRLSIALLVARLARSQETGSTNGLPPRLMFTDATSCWKRRVSNTYSSAAIWSELQDSGQGPAPDPQLAPSKREKTCTAITSAPGATPE